MSIEGVRLREGCGGGSLKAGPPKSRDDGCRHPSRAPTRRRSQRATREVVARLCRWQRGRQDLCLDPRPWLQGLRPLARYQEMERGRKKGRWEGGCAEVGRGQNGVNPGPVSQAREDGGDESNDSESNCLEVAMASLPVLFPAIRGQPAKSRTR